MQKVYSFIENFLLSSKLEPEKFLLKKGSVGKAIPGCEIMLVNEKGKKCEANEVGELLFRGPTVAKGYWGIENDIVFVDNPFNNYYKEKIVKSGDLMYEDQDGYLYFVGRKDKMIKKYGYRTNGFQISNEILNSCCFVKACCVIGVKKKEGEQCIFAFVELNAGEDKEKRRRDILEYSRKHLPLYMRIDSIIIVNSIPKLNSNKYDTNTLEVMAQEYIEDVKIRKTVP